MTARSLILLSDKTISSVQRSLNALLRDAQLSWSVQDAGFDSWLRETMNPDSAARNDRSAALGYLLSPRILDLPGDGSTQLDAVLEVLERRASGNTVLFSNLFADPLRILPVARHADMLRAVSEINNRLYTFSQRHSWFHVVDHCASSYRRPLWP